ncbi:hypothetical protein [Xenorhabdus bovienii]|uniref:hypothetical protein n=1 Tax=Xenorhabdus bovienii TaxID=40576 RepID=UPI0023B245BA|nr:hypothetical protein [Xenorhabdus bovienii]MDE9483457.1 hypothetical protein [Xenorhabdus bovienii]
MILSKNNNINSGIEFHLSVPDGADVAISQEFYVDITLLSDFSLSNFPDITIVNPVGLKKIDIITPTYLSEDYKSAHIKIYLTVEDDKVIKHGVKNVSYDIQVPGHNLKTVSYNAKIIEPYTIQLEPNKQVCVAPKVSKQPDNNSNNYVRYNAKLFDHYGQVMKNTPIQVYSMVQNDLVKRVMVTTDPQNGNDSPEVIKPTIDSQVFFTVYSDKKGKVSFRVYPMANNYVTLRLLSNIFGVKGYYEADNVYILTPPPGEDALFLEPPNIIQANGGILRGGKGKHLIDVQIDTNIELSSTDSILFFTKDNNGLPEPEGLVLPVKSISSEDANNNIFSFPYNIFPENERSELYYIIASYFGVSKYSGTMMIEYIGGSSNTPSDNVTRTYNKIIAYSSFADYEHDPLLKNSEKNLLWENVYINLGTIANYAHNNQVDLYLKVIGTNDPNDETKKYPYVGNDIYLNIYVNSKSKNFMHTYRHKLSDTPDEQGTALCTTVIKICHPELTGIAPYTDGKRPWIYFEYYTIDKGANEKTYNHYWKSMIDTTLPGDKDDE